MAKFTILIVAVLFAGALAKGHSSHSSHSSHGTHTKHGRGLTAADLASLKAMAIRPRLEKLEKGSQSAAVSPANGQSMEEEGFFGSKVLLEEECSKLAVYLSKISNPPPTDVMAGIRLAKCAQCINRVCAALEESAQSVVLHWALDQAWQCATGIATHAIHHSTGLSAIAGALGECTKGVIDDWLDTGAQTILKRVNFLEAANTAACQTVCEEYSSELALDQKPYHLFDVTGPKGMRDLNTFMEHRKYFNGQNPCVLDADMFLALGDHEPDSGTYPYAFRYLQQLRADGDPLIQSYRSIDYR